MQPQRPCSEVAVLGGPSGSAMLQAPVGKDIRPVAPDVVPERNAVEADSRHQEPNEDIESEYDTSAHRRVAI